MATYTQPVVLTGIWGKNAAPEKELSIFVEGALQRAGEEIVTLMKAETKPFDFKGTLTKSIAWRTANRAKAIPNSAHLIAAPKATNTVDIGSAAPHAYYREYGAGPHRTKAGSLEFLASMREWVAKVIGINTTASATPEEKSHFWAIVNTVRKGMDAQMGRQGLQPFVRPVEWKIPALATRIANDMLTQYWAAMQKKYKV
jgi:hypothetical protein